MIDQGKVKKLLVVSLLGVVFLAQSAVAYAGNPGWSRGHDRGNNHGRNDHGYRYGHNYPAGRVEVGLPRGFISIVFGGGRYYYGKGAFYRHEPRGYVVVPPSSGMIISRLPEGYHRVIIDGIAYYTYDGIYYKRASRGFEVVEPPATVVFESVAPVFREVRSTTQQVFAVNIPTGNGDFMEIILRKSGNGFIGPQGEFYSAFPNVEQLRVMYARSK